MFDLAIRGGRVVTPEGIVEGDIAVTGGRIAAIGRDLGAARQQIDGAGRWIMPGGVDPHCHIEQMSGMGLMNADTWETATRSAALGGTTTVVAFAAQAKGQRLQDAMSDYSARAARGARVDHAFHIIAADPDAPAFESDLAALIGAGHRSIKLFTTYNIGLDDTQILRTLRLAKTHGALVCVHAENDAIIAEARARLLAAGHTTPRDHARSRPREAEIEAIERICQMAAYVDTPVMVFHVSTAEGAATIARAKATGVPVTAETCPHYLLMTEDILDRPQGAKWMCSPPQRTLADQTALWDALLTGTLDLVSSDHAPYRMDATGKLSSGPDAPFDQIANGLPGLEPRLPLMFDAMVTKGQGGPEAFARLTATTPARLHGLPGKGALTPGHDADIVIWDAARTHRYGANDLHDNVGYNPWEGVTVQGWPDTVLLRGHPIVTQGTLHAAPGTGQWLPRPLPPSSS